jgi:pimeloyl-ACP methyl ester carboxylesterase
MKSITRTDGTTIAYRIGGIKDGEPIIMMHGAGSNHSTWLNTAGALAGTRWIAVDMRGHGCSGGTPHLKENVSDIIAIADAERIKRFSVAGICVGGTVALDVARRHPQRVSRVIVVSPFDTELIAGALMLRTLCRVVKRITPLFPPKRKLTLIDYRTPPSLPFILTPINDLRGVYAKHYCNSTLTSLNNTSHIHDIKAPVLFITGKRDIFLKKNILRKRIKRHPMARWIEIDANHHLLTWKPAEVSAIINRFIREE